MKVLLTAFDPFGGEKVNPALEAVKLVNVTSVSMEKLEVPTVFHKAIDRVAERIKEVEPDVVLAIGQAGGRFDITVERVAINIDDARIPDNEGNQPIDVPIVAGAPPAYFSTLPIKAMVEAIRKAGIPATVSNTAGTFVCNHLMYGILHTLAALDRPVRGGFIHVPFVPGQVIAKPFVPSMALADITRAIEVAIAAIIAHETDITQSGGKEF
ncbi:MAG: pyroglutamyl-peptidase I [Sphaerochaeta sp.]|jgi:pyroglutamyl-peptidase|nr:pyroglutamyl-peptidase I [Sphaerochaeta sp.]MDX9915593.1 pyroglutamyl-peptidase I [Sphaerochaeta sp.]